MIGLGILIKVMGWVTLDYSFRRIQFEQAQGISRRHGGVVVRLVVEFNVLQFNLLTEKVLILRLLLLLFCL